jgi:hypothetical protein
MYGEKLLGNGQLAISGELHLFSLWMKTSYIHDPANIALKAQTLEANYRELVCRDAAR